MTVCIACQGEPHEPGSRWESPRSTLFGRLCGFCAAEWRLPRPLTLCQYTGKYRRTPTPRATVARLLGVSGPKPSAEDVDAWYRAAGARLKEANRAAGWTGDWFRPIPPQRRAAA